MWQRVAARDGVAEFLASTESKLERLAAAINELDYHEAERLAQELKGSFARFGMMRAQMLALEIAHLAEIGHGEDLWSLHQSMRGCFAAGKRALLASWRERAIGA